MPDIHVIKPTVFAEICALRVAAYCRVSGDSEDQLNSFCNQVQYFTELIGGNSAWQLVDIYADEARTGTRADTRPEFQRLLRDCRRGKIDKIIVKSISRFSRNMKDSLSSIRELKQLGVEIFFEKEQLDTGSFTGEMLLSFYGTIAQEESVSISRNMRIGIQNRIRKGDYTPSCAPLGYRIESGNLVIDENEAGIVRYIFQSYLSGKGTPTIASELSQMGFISRCGNAYRSHRTVLDILGNERYIGDVLLQKSYMTDTLPYRKRRNRGERDQVYIHNNHAAIISRDDFEQAAALREQQRNRHWRPKSGQRYPFSSRIICGECGQTFRRRVWNGKTYWVCMGHNKDKERCSVRQIPEPFIEDAFLRLWNKLRSHRRIILYPVLEQLESFHAAASKRNGRLCEIDLRIADLSQRNHVLNTMRAKGYIDSVIFMEKTNEINTETDALRNDRRRLIEDDDDDPIDTTRCLIDTLESVPEPLTAFDTVFFDGIVEKIIAVSQTEVRFALINGLELTETVERIRR